jgi:hypothetical protein
MTLLALHGELELIPEIDRAVYPNLPHRGTFQWIHYAILNATREQKQHDGRHAILSP